MSIDPTPRFTMKSTIAALAVASMLLLTTGCGEEEDVYQSTSGSSGGSDSDKNGNGKDGKDGKDADGDKDGSQGATLTGADCFPGNWTVDNTGMQNYMESLSGGAKVTTTGRVLLTYNLDGSAQTNYDHWTNTIVMSEGSSVVERHGVDQGSYTASNNGTFTISDNTIGSVTKVSVSGPSGQIVSMAVDPEPSVLDEGTYTCSGDTLTMMVDGYNLVSHRGH